MKMLSRILLIALFVFLFALCLDIMIDVNNKINIQNNQIKIYEKNIQINQKDIKIYKDENIILKKQYTELNQKYQKLTSRTAKPRVTNKVTKKVVKINKITRPVSSKYYINSDYGYRIDPFTHRKDFHNGIDIACPKGTNVKVYKSGEVIFAGWNGNYGKCIKIKNNNTIYLYAHLSDISVKINENINSGNYIGKVGSTGRSTGYHLHFSIFVNNKPINPAKYIK
jgi:murein DD-endopeptidase MepM/ murein hydrolase activator NlpD